MFKKSKLNIFAITSTYRTRRIRILNFISSKCRNRYLVRSPITLQQNSSDLPLIHNEITATREYSHIAQLILRMGFLIRVSRVRHRQVSVHCLCITKKVHSFTWVKKDRAIWRQATRVTFGKWKSTHHNQFSITVSRILTKFNKHSHRLLPKIQKLEIVRISPYSTTTTYLYRYLSMLWGNKIIPSLWTLTPANKLITINSSLCSPDL